MRNLSPAMQAHVAGQATTLCTCWHLIRKDGVEMGFTDHDADLTVDALVYKCATGFKASTVESKADLSVDNLELDGILNSGDITEADVLNGKYDYAEVEIFMVNYESLGDGKIYVKRGRMGEVRIARAGFVAELRSLTQHLQQRIGEVYAPSCNAILGDARCGKDLTAFTFTATITEVISRAQFKASALTQDAGFFTGGEVLFTSGDNDDLRMEIKEFSNKQFTLVLPMPNNVAVGDNFNAIAGCDKTISTCVAKFNNAVNFRGEPYVPGMDKMLETAATSNDLQTA